MANNKKFNIKKTTLDKIRDLIETTGCTNVAEFIATPAYKMYLDNPYPMLNSLERKYIDVIIRGVFSGCSNQDIIDQIRLLWRASDMHDGGESVDRLEPASEDINIDIPDTEDVNEVLILEDGSLRSEQTERDSDQEDSVSATTTVETDVVTTNNTNNNTKPNIDRNAIIDDVMGVHNKPKPTSSINPTTPSTVSFSVSAAPNLTSCKNINEMRDVLLASGYKGRVGNPLYGKPFVPIYTDDEINKATPGRRISMRMENAMAKTNQNMPYIVVC
jgi:hypothetical protein